MDEVKLQLRLPPDVHAELVVAAKQNERSLNAELVARLRATLKPSAIEERVAALEHQVAQLLKNKGRAG